MEDIADEHYALAQEDENGEDGNDDVEIRGAVASQPKDPAQTLNGPAHN